MTETFTLRDRKGVEHAYTVEPHPAHEGVVLCAQVAALSIPGLLSALGSAMESDGLRKAISGAFTADAATGDRQAGIAELTSYVAKLDFSAIGKDLSGGLLAPEFAPLVERILAHTKRSMGEGEPGMSLANRDFFDAAFTANYWELAQALFRVCAVNGFFPDLSGFSTYATSLVTPDSATTPTSDSGGSPAATD